MLRGNDSARQPALPVGEAMHPIALVALAVLLGNDWLGKRWFGPNVVTGKLSDLAGLVTAPVALSATIGLVLHLAMRLGARVDPSLSRRRLVACIIATGAGFAAIKLSPIAAAWFVTLTSHLGRPAHVVVDPTDLLCLPALGVALWIGRDELRRIPLGRPAAIHRLGRPAALALTDVVWAGGSAQQVASLAAAIDGWRVDAVDELLAHTSHTGR